MKKIWSLSLLVGLTLLACKKEELVIPESETPIFRANGTIDGEPFSIVAGDNGAYMHTKARKENRVDVYGGELSDETFAIEMEFYDGNIDLSDLGSIASMPEFLEFVEYNSEPLVVLNKNLFMNSSVIETITWTINDTISATNFYQVLEPGIYDVCADVQFIDGVQKSICEELTIGYKNNAHGTISVVQNQQGIMDGWLTPVGSDIESIRWYKNNSLFCYYQSWSTQINEGFQDLEVHVQFENGVQKVMRTVFDGSYYERNIESLSIFETQVEEQLERDFDVRLKLLYNGTEYVSDFADNSESTVNVLSVEYYGKNDAGKDTYKIDAEVSAKVQENQNSSPKVINFSTTFGLEVQ